MVGYLRRNANGVKEVLEGDVRPPWELNYRERHTMSQREWGFWWEVKMSFETAKIIKVHPGLYWAFPEDDGKIEYGMYGGFAIPANITPCIVDPSGAKIDIHRADRRFERFLWPEDGGYRDRRSTRDGGL